MKFIGNLVDAEPQSTLQRDPPSILQIATPQSGLNSFDLLDFALRLGVDGIIRGVEIIGGDAQQSQATNFLIGRTLAEVIPDGMWQPLNRSIVNFWQQGKAYSLTVDVPVVGHTYNLEVLILPNGIDELLLVCRDLTAAKLNAFKALTLNRALISVQAAATAINLNLEQEQVLETFNWEITHLLDSSGCSIYFLEKGVGKQDLLSLVASYTVESASDQISFVPTCQLNDFSPLKQTVRDRFPQQISVLDSIYGTQYISDLRASGVTGLLLLPMVFQERVLGIAKVVLWQTNRRFTEQEISLAQLLTNQATAAIANAHLYDETQKRLHEQTALRKAGAIFSSTLDQNRILQRIAEHLCTTVDVNCVVIRNYDSVTYSGHFIAQHLKSTICDESVIALLQQKAFLFSPAAVASFEANRPHSWQIDDADIPEFPGRLMPLLDADVLLGVPMMLAGRMIAIAELWGNRSGRLFEQNEIELVQSITQQAAIAMENSRLYQELDHRLNELSTLNRISQAISSTLDLQETLTIITNSAVKLLNSSACSVALVNDDGRTLRFAAASGVMSELIVGKEISIDDGIVGWVARTGEAVLIPDVSQDPRHFKKFDNASGYTTATVICVPLLARGITIGALSIFNKVESRFDGEDMRLLKSLATPATTAIENAVLFQRASLEIEERKRAELNLEAERTSLAQRVEARTLELKQANETLGKAARMKDEFLASMSHELRTPLNAILGISQGLVEQFYGPHNERQLHSLRLVHQSGRHLLELINDILDISKIEAKQLTINVGLVSVQDLCLESVRLIKQTAYDKQIELTCHIDNDLTIFYADPRRLKQILINLLSNAVKFTPAGGQVGLEVQQDRSNDTVNFRVWDTGIGIPEDNHDQLFQPFIQLDSRLSRNYAGTGLGLALVRRLTELHGGTVTLESVPGEGSSFLVSLPRRSEASHSQVNDADTMAVSMPQLPMSQQPSIADNPLVLLVDDDELVATIFADLLTKMGCQIIRARNGLEAIEQFALQTPALILMDIQMPEMDGLEAMRQIRQMPGAADVSIIALTALAMEGDRELCLAAGADEYLSKPVTLQTLKTTMEHYLTVAKKEYSR